MSSQTVNIQGLHRADVLAALYNASAPTAARHQREGGATHQIARREAADMLAAFKEDGITSLERVGGRMVPINLLEDYLDPSAYDRANGGPGTMKRAIEHLRSTGQVSA